MFVTNKDSLSIIIIIMATSHCIACNVHQAVEKICLVWNQPRFYKQRSTFPEALWHIWAHLSAQSLYPIRWVRRSSSRQTMPWWSMMHCSRPLWVWEKSITWWCLQTTWKASRRSRCTHRVKTHRSSLSTFRRLSKLKRALQRWPKRLLSILKAVQMERLSKAWKDAENEMKCVECQLMS